MKGRAIGMNLKNCNEYTIGLDIGTGSVGWAVIDEKGNLLKFKGKNTWGSRLFDGAETAASTRIARTLRRRYNRRNQRIQDLRKMMEADIAEVDKNFFYRLDQSSLWPEDKPSEYAYLLTQKDTDSVKDYFGRFNTIYHLRDHLVRSEEKEDIRLVYLAIHHILKYRGHFLWAGNVSAKDANTNEIVVDFLNELESHCINEGIDFSLSSIDKNELALIITSSGKKRAEKVDEFTNALGLPSDQKKRAKAIAHAVFGYQTQFSELFAVEANSDTKFNLSKDEKVEKFVDEIISEEDLPLFIALQSLYNSYLLAGLLKGSNGTLSSAFINQWDRHQQELKQLKDLVKKYVPEKYNDTFRGSKYPDGTYKKKDSEGYTAYNLGKYKRAEFYDYLTKKVFNGVAFENEDEKTWVDIQNAIKEETYLKKLRTSDNGAIPHQLHLEELHQIIQHQKKYYATLNENIEKIESLLTFRIPYYVGPLGKNKNPNREKPFSWMVRNEGQEGIEIKPWNFDEVVNRDKTAELFITNLTGDCSYYLGKKVIPKNSLLYSEFCVRQELNVCRVAYDGENFTRFDSEASEKIFEELFKKKKKVKVKDLENFLQTELGYINRTVRGTQKENEFASSLTSYIDFTNILGRPIENPEDIEMVEEIITWITVFEDKKILERKLDQVYGSSSENKTLDAQQVKKICKLRYSGWSNLSREFLEELRADFEGARISIMGVLRNSRKSTPMNLMEILADERFSFQALLEKENENYLESTQGYYLDSIPGSPAIKRGINQSMEIVKEITTIAGKPPVRICVEMAREEVGKGKGSRTKARLSAIEDMYAEAKNNKFLVGDVSKCNDDLKESKENLNNEKVFLYHLQLGKCMYCKESIDIENLSAYQVDHIVPQSFIKDDSIDNKVLVHAKCNQNKSDVYPLSGDIRQTMFPRWKALRDAGLLSARKFEKLMSDRMDDRQIKRFINRQLVETRQISKHVVELLQAFYQDTVVESVKAELTHDLRKQYGFCKSRLVNDYHHAHDAYLACQISRFVQERYPKIHKDFDYSQFTKYTASARKNRYSSKGFIVGSFGYTGFDKETGEITRDTWDAEFELEKIRACLNYKDCFISRKVEQLKGKFWGETVYSRREQIGKMIPLKKGLAPEKYGYYQGADSAFYSLITYMYKSRGKKKEKTELVGIPINIAYGITHEDDLRKYLEQNYEGAQILIPKIMKYQKIEWDGGTYYLTSQSEMINARQLWVPSKYLKFLENCEHIKSEHEDTLTADAIDFYEYLCTQIESNYPRYKNVVAGLTSSKSEDRFKQASLPEKFEMLSEILNVLHCDSTRGLGKWGLSPRAGRMDAINFGGSIASIVWIYSSITGMYENRREL